MERDFAGLLFSYVGQILPKRDERGERGKVIAYLPQKRHRNEQNLPLHEYGNGPFCRFQIAQESRWRLGGVYVLAEGEESRYVGETQELTNRWRTRGYGSIQPRNCFHRGQPTNCRINNLIYERTRTGADFYLWFRPIDGADVKKRKEAEAKLVKELSPPWNK